MSETTTTRSCLFGFALAGLIGIGAPLAVVWAYIDQPVESLTVPKLVLEFRSIGILQIEKLDRERGAVVFKLVEQIQGPITFTTTRHALSNSGGGMPEEFKNIKVGDKALFFSGDGYHRGLTLLDAGWYCSTNNDKRSEWWHMGYTASHYDFNCAFTGSAAELTDAVRRLLLGDDVVVKSRKKKQMPETQWVKYNLRQAGRKEVVPAAAGAGASRVDLTGRSMAELEQALRDDKFAVRAAAAEALARHGESAVAPLAKALRSDPDPFVRRAAAVSLGVLGPKAKDAVSTLIDRLQNQYENLEGLVGSESAEALRKIDPDGALTVAVLTARLKGPSPDLKMRTADQLAMIGPIVKAAAPALIETLKDKSPDVRYAIVGALFALKPDPDLLVPVLIVAVKDDHHYVRARAVRVLEALGPVAKAALPVLQEAAKDSDADVRAHAKDAIQRISGK